MWMREKENTTGLTGLEVVALHDIEETLGRIPSKIRDFWSTLTPMLHAQYQLSQQ